VPPRIEPVNTTGAGDALLAGYLASTDADIKARLGRAVALAASVCLSGMTAALPPVVRQVTMSEIDVHDGSVSGCCAPCLGFRVRSRASTTG
jgi:fructose-1-phosphate kinase PfkB-like protein